MNKNIMLIALLVVGNLIGAGILALPIQTGGAGLLFSFAAMVMVCVFMYLSAVILAKEAVDFKNENFNYPSLYEKYIGTFGKWGAVIANMLILYGALTAYLCGGTSIITGIFGNPTNTTLRIVILALLFIALSAFTMRGTKIIARYNSVLMLILALTFIVIVALGLFHIDPKREVFLNLEFIPIVIPVILTSFHFHNIIPSISKTLNWDIKAISLAMLIGMIIGLAMNAIWVFVGIGVLPLTVGNNSIVYAFEHGLPATVPISAVLSMPIFTLFATIFALVAICSSYAANGMGLMDFNRDLLNNTLKIESKLLLLVFTFIPPLLIAIFFPNIFLKAIGIIGGIGIAILFGILPAILLFLRTKASSLRLVAVIMFLFFLAVLSMDLCNDFGIIKASDLVQEIGAKVTRFGI